jgi:hypothetical protein
MDMVKLMKLFDKAFLTGCDEKTEWMLPWFLENYSKWNNTPLIFANFGVSKDCLKAIKDKSKNNPIKHIVDMTKHKEKGWFKKPKSMLDASELSEYTCWIDTDFEILSDMSSVFNYVEENRLGMVEDKPWSARRGEVWHNSGIVAFKGTPLILHQWVGLVRTKPSVGDQETLHEMLKEHPLQRMIYITSLPNEYNWLRIQLLDGQDSKKKKAIHWTGYKGKDKIRSLMSK